MWSTRAAVAASVVEYASGGAPASASGESSAASAAELPNTWSKPARSPSQPPHRARPFTSTPSASSSTHTRVGSAYTSAAHAMDARPL